MRTLSWPRLLLVASFVVSAVGLAACASDAPSPGTAAEELAAPFGRTTVVLAPAASDAGEPVTLSVYVADTAGLRRRGLMGWESLPDDTGMLFVYDRDSESAFWMKDTLIELSIAFAAADGTIHTILDMSPCTADPCPLYPPNEPYRYALEVEQGEFARRGIGLGWLLDIDDTAD